MGKLPPPLAIDPNHAVKDNKGKTLKFLKTFFAVWGVISFLVVLIISGSIIWMAGPGNREKVDKVTKKDVGYILNWSGLGADRITDVIHSYKSSRSMTGDHFDAYAIKIVPIPETELNNTYDQFQRWYRGDQLPRLLVDAIEFSFNFPEIKSLKWLPSKDEIKSKRYCIQVWGAYYSGDGISETRLIIYCPEESVIYFVSAKV
jgi:hypothetical protein